MAAALTKFQSTLPVRGATPSQASIEAEHYISIHAPREGSDRRFITSRARGTVFQSTLPVRGATPFHSGDNTASLFQSTLPVRGATLPPDKIQLMKEISIHAPREGSDKSLFGSDLSGLNFNPRSP